MFIYIFSIIKHRTIFSLGNHYAIFCIDMHINSPRLIFCRNQTTFECSRRAVPLEINLFIITRVQSRIVIVCFFGDDVMNRNITKGRLYSNHRRRGLINTPCQFAIHIIFRNFMKLRIQHSLLHLHGRASLVNLYSGRHSNPRIIFIQKSCCKRSYRTGTEQIY